MFTAVDGVGHFDETAKSANSSSSSMETAIVYWGGGVI